MRGGSFVLLFLYDRVMIGNCGWPRTCNVDQTSLEPGAIFLLLLLGYWNFVHEPLALEVSIFESP